MSARTKRRSRGKPPAPFKSWLEVDVFNHLISKEIEFEYEKHKFPYFKEAKAGICLSCGSAAVGTKHKYTPDFVLGNGIIIECKGKLDRLARSKILAILEADNAIDDTNFKLLFQTNNWTTKTHTERYVTWAGRHGIDSSVYPIIPKEWLE